jgi:diguanylate cyclase (GGDEF)-like protein
MTAKRKITFGVLLGWQIYDEGAHPSRFGGPILRGVQAAARDQGINLMVACGIARMMKPARLRPAWPEPSLEEDFVPVGPWNTDGLLLLSPLRSEARMAYARQLIDREFPVLFIGTGDGFPTIMVDNEMGIRQMMEHLIGHGHRRIAFIAGDEQDPGDSLTRLTAYRKGVQEFGLSDDPRLVEHGRHWDVGGQEAMQRVLQSGVEFTAVMCSNDGSAVGVMKALKEAGLRIPWDVAVTSFDDVLEGLAQVPPLTSVHYPLFEAGYRSLFLLRKRMESGPRALPDVVRVSTWLVARQSCGCLPEIVAKAEGGTASPIVSADKSSKQFKEELAQAMLEALLSETSPAQKRELSPLCDRLVNGFLQSLEDGELSHFQIALIEVLQRVEMMREDDAYIWQAAISVLRQGGRAILKEDRTSRREERAEDLLHQARTLLNESTRRRYTRLQLQQSNRDEEMGRLTSRLISSMDEEQVYNALQESLPQVGVNSCHVAYFEPQGDDPVAMSLLHSLEKGAPVLRFETRKFPPPGLYPEDKPFNLALLPLFFQEKNLGYVAFDGDFLEPLATIVRQLSSAIGSVQLHQQVLELSLTDALTAIHNRRYFEIMLQKEVDRSQRYSRDLAVIMADIDRFKQYNDAFGHPAGDRALQEVAQCITQGARRGLDVVTRYGGEEFAIILPETDTEGAKIVAEKIRVEMAASGAYLRTTTISLGIASLRGDRLQPQLLVDQADRALYQAKNQGRNRAVVYEGWMQDAAHAQAADGSLTAAAAPSGRE